jgi:hypothetical protein
VELSGLQTNQRGICPCDWIDGHRYDSLTQVSDIVLLRKVAVDQRELYASPRQAAKQQLVSRSLTANNYATWFLLACDIAVKALAIRGYPWLFDSIISIATIAMRARCNLEYGLNLRNIFNPARDNNSKTEHAKSMNVRNKDLLS